MDIVVPCCAGLDIHKKTVVACVRCRQGNGPVAKEVRTFGTIEATEGRVSRVGALVLGAVG
jgi:hypothetical protein